MSAGLPALLGAAALTAAPAPAAPLSGGCPGGIGAVFACGRMAAEARARRFALTHCSGPVDLVPDLSSFALGCG